MTVHDVTLRRPVARVQAGRRRKTLTFIAEHAVAIALALVFLAPFAFIVLTSLMTNEQALTPDLWPTSWHLDNYVKVFQNAPMWRYLANSLMYSVLATGFMLLSSVPAAYALARLRWRGRDLAFLGVLVMMMLPPQVTIVPLYVLWARWNLTGTLWPLILPNLFGDAFSIFLIRQFLLTIPEEYADAARGRLLGAASHVEDHPAAGETRHRRRGLVHVLPHLERLLRAAALYQRERRQLDAGARPGNLP
jgi:multiple sugar transport system permease protein